MKNKTVLSNSLKRWLSFAFVVMLVCSLGLVLKQEAYRFNPQYLVENSVLNGRDFKAEVQQIESPKLKIKAWLYEDYANPLVNISIMFRRAGVAYDNGKRFGESVLLADMLMAGAGKYNIKAFQNELERRAASMNFEALKDGFYGDLRFVTKDRFKVAELFNLALTKPRFAPEQLKVALNSAVTSYYRHQEDAASYLSVAAEDELYAGHPLGRNVYGSPKTLSAVRPEHLRSYLKKHLVTDNLIVGISGHISADEAGHLLDKMFAGVPQKNTVAELPELQVSFSEKVVVFPASTGQEIGRLYAAAPARLSPEFYPTMMALELLFGDSLDSRIHKEAREKAGLTYGAYATMRFNDRLNYITGQFSATTDKFPQLLFIVNEEWQRLGREGMTERELNTVKKRLIASDILRYTDGLQLSRTLLMMQKFNLGVDFLQKNSEYIRNVNLEEVNTAAKKYFTEDNLRLFILYAENKNQGVNKNGNDG